MRVIENKFLRHHAQLEEHLTNRQLRAGDHYDVLQLFCLEAGRAKRQGVRARVEATEGEIAPLVCSGFAQMACVLMAAVNGYS